MRRLFGLAIVTALLACSQDVDQTEQWRGLVLGRSTPADAESRLGKPEKDKADSLVVPYIGGRFNQEVKKKTLRKQTYKGLPNFDSVELHFRNNVLVAITLLPSGGIDPAALKSTYGVEFRTERMAYDETLANWRKESSKVLPPYYGLIGEGPRSVVCASVKNNGIGATLVRSLGGADSMGGFPGKVHAVQLISRQLEGGSQSDLLK